MNEKYEKCEKCGRESVHLGVSSSIVFHGDSDDSNGDESPYADAMLATYTMYEDETVILQDISIGIHACFECGHMVDVWCEHPRDELTDACYDLPRIIQSSIVRFVKIKRWLQNNA